MRSQTLSPMLQFVELCDLPHQRSEADIIAARVRSHAKWRRRRDVLRFRAVLFGRSKEKEQRPQAPVLRPACQP